MLSNWSKDLHVDHPDFDLLRRPAWRGVVLTFYISVIVIGLVGNAVVVFIVAKNKHMQNVTNIFIANLALSDIGLCMFSLPIQLHYQITDNWVFGHVMCKVIFAAFAVPMYVSTLTIFLIALDRYWLIVYPLTNRMQVRTALLLVLSALIVSLALAVPVICFSREHHLHQPDILVDRLYCIEHWPHPLPRIIYSICTFVLQFCLPLIMTALLYYKIYCRLKRRPTHRTSNTDRTGKTNKILFAIVVLFVVCWLPWNLYSLLTEIDRNIVWGIHFKLIDLFLKMFAMSSSCVNPFLYCWLNDNFRKELDTMAVKLRILRQPSLQRQPRSGLNPPPTIRENGHSNIMTENNLLCPTTTITADRTSHYSNAMSHLHSVSTNLLTVL